MLPSKSFSLSLTDWQGDERYLYSGKELDRTGGLMLYDFHARQYDPQLGRFTTQDPLQDKYTSLSSYLYCAANPVSLTDPTGKYMRGGNLEVANYHVRNLQSAITDLTNENKMSPVQDYEARLAEMVNSIADANDAISDKDIEYIVNVVYPKDGEYVYNRTVPGSLNEYGHNTYDVTVENNTGKMAHEFRHVGQIARGEMSENITSENKYNITHEVDAYRAEFGVNGVIEYYPLNYLENIDNFKKLQQSHGDTRILLKRITEMGRINADIIREFCDPSGTPIYKDLE